jgi:uncharacterized membrane protein YeaQ/YmgE (transglycosylase-associated protein family)
MEIVISIVLAFSGSLLLDALGLGTLAFAIERTLWSSSRLSRGLAWTAALLMAKFIMDEYLLALMSDAYRMQRDAPLGMLAFWKIAIGTPVGAFCGRWLTKPITIETS